MKKRVFIRADGNSDIGLGHVFRCLALVEMLKEEFNCHFLTRNPLAGVKFQIEQLCHGITELTDTLTSAEEASYLASKLLSKDDIVVLDGYHFDTEYQRTIKDTGCALVCIDDIHTCHFVADAVINHAGGVTASAYSAEDYTRFYLGPQYTLIRSAYFKKKNILSSDADESIGMQVLLCMGGADPQNDTLTILKELDQSLPHDTIVQIVVGAGYRFEGTLTAFLKDQKRFVLHKSLALHEMATLMQQCQRAIVPASTIAYEFMAGGGITYLKVIANNQKNIYNYFINEGLAVPYAGRLDTFDRSDAREMLEKQQAIFDGKSQARIVTIFKTLAEK